MRAAGRRLTPAALRRLRGRGGLVAHTRWLFCVAALLSYTLTAPAGVADGTAPGALLLAAATVALFASWIHRYRTERAPLLLDVLDAVAVGAFAVACTVPAAAYAFVFPAVWFRALYGRTRRVYLYCAFVAAGFAAAVPLWGLLPGRVGAVRGEEVFGSLPVMFVTVVVARHLALSLFAREQTRRRDAALAGLGTRLLGVTDRGIIDEHAWRTAVEICEVTPGLRALAVVPADGELQVVGHAGPFVQPPARLPWETLPADPGRAGPPGQAGPLAAAAGTRGEWVVLPLPGPPEAWMVLGAPGAIPDEGMVAIRSMINQVALAVLTSEAHLDLTVQATTDPLTGLLNRSAFTSALGAAVGDGGTLLFLDLDDFKLVNDGHGHLAGDELLRRVAERIAATVGPGDLSARLGGDEFAVLLRGASAPAAEDLAGRLVELVGEPAAIEDRTVRVGVSIGLVHVTPGSSPERLIQQADLAMYTAKGRGKNRVQPFVPDLSRDDRAAFEADLAAAAGAGQLVVHYQPILSVRTGSCIAVEALVRWQHPTRGLVPPGDFIGVAERIGAIAGIGEFVLREVCRDVGPWAVEGEGIAVHVNVSAAQLADRGLVDTVRSCLEESGLAPHRLVVEVTESMVLTSREVRATMVALRGLGVRLGVDDFGTGYSSLATLRTLPLDIVKIDRSFVDGGPADPADHAVLSAITEMARRLGLETIGEGVERPDQQQLLSDVGATGVQGFLHQRPVPAEGFRAWLEGRAATAASHGSLTPAVPG